MDTILGILCSLVFSASTLFLVYWFIFLKTDKISYQALNYLIFSTQEDHLVWDVSHNDPFRTAYVGKSRMVPYQYHLEIDNSETVAFVKLRFLSVYLHQPNSFRKKIAYLPIKPAHLFRRLEKEITQQLESKNAVNGKAEG